MFNQQNLTNAFFISVVVLLLLGFIYVFAPFAGIFFIALILVELFYPWYEFLKAKLRFEILATSIAGITVILSVVIPLIILGIIIVAQANTLLDDVGTFWTDRTLVEEIKDGLDQVNEVIASVSSNPEHQITTQELQNTGIDFSEKFLNSIINSLSSSATSVARFIAQFFLLLVLIFVLFPNRDKLYKAIKDLSPLEDDVDQLFIKNLKDSSKDVLLATFVTAVGLGVLGGLTYWVIGIQSPVFWGMIISIATLIPTGASIVWFPTVIYLAITGQTLEAIVLFIIGMLMTYVFDTMLKTMISRKEAVLNSTILAFAIIGGLETFGTMGFIYGPMIVVTFISIMKVYKAKFAEKEK
ncbi:AI-2E family transporter [Candidatus Dojkabacteria bacterium]|nr:AI-2E family transporter [Candidatus Dojkabacteria bacterium]